MGTVELSWRRRAALAAAFSAGLCLAPIHRADASPGPTLNNERPTLDSEGSEASTGEARELRTRGGLRLGIGSVLAGAGVALIAFGVVEFQRAQNHLALCRERGLEPGTGMGLDIGDPCSFDPAPLGFTSAGLSWGLSIPMLVGAGLLLARGAKLVRASREPTGPRVSVYPWWQGSGGGAGLTLRF